MDTSFEEFKMWSADFRMLASKNEPNGIIVGLASLKGNYSVSFEMVDLELPPIEEKPTVISNRFSQPLSVQPTPYPLSFAALNKEIQDFIRSKEISYFSSATEIPAKIEVYLSKTFQISNKKLDFAQIQVQNSKFAYMKEGLSTNNKFSTYFPNDASNSKKMILNYLHNARALFLQANKLIHSLTHLLLKNTIHSVIDDEDISVQKKEQKYGLKGGISTLLVLPFSEILFNLQKQAKISVECNETETFFWIIHMEKVFSVWKDISESSILPLDRQKILYLFVLAESSWKSKENFSDLIERCVSVLFSICDLSEGVKDWLIFKFCVLTFCCATKSTQVVLSIQRLVLNCIEKASSLVESQAIISKLVSKNKAKMLEFRIAVETLKQDTLRFTNMHTFLWHINLDNLLVKRANGILRSIERSLRSFKECTTEIESKISDLIKHN